MFHEMCKQPYKQHTSQCGNVTNAHSPFPQVHTFQTGALNGQDTSQSSSCLSGMPTLRAGIHDMLLFGATTGCYTS